MRARVIVFCALLIAPASKAEEIRYDNGEVLGALQGIQAGDAEAMRLTTAHPASLEAIRLLFSEPGEVEVHVWADNGGQQPDMDCDLIEPIRRQVVDESGLLEIAIEPAVELGPEIHFFVGHVLLEDGGPGLAVDSSLVTDCRALLRAWSDELRAMTWFTVADAEGCRNYLVRAEVTYHDIVTDRRFADISDESGFGRPSRVAAVDFDGDGDVDVLQGQRLLRNDGGAFTDISAESGLGGYPSVSGGVFADYDRDGDLDLFLFVSTCCDEQEAGGVHDVLLRNDDGVFVDATGPAGPFDYFPNQAASWGDFDNDGWPDLYLPGYERADEMSLPTADSLWRNNGDGTFSDWTARSWIGWPESVCSRTVPWADYDEDGWLDVYVGAYRLQRNYLFHNSGGSFEELGAATGTAGIETRGYFGHTIGAEWGDLDNDTDLDLVVMNLAHPRFLDFSDLSKIYLSRLAETGQAVFEDVRERVGVAYVETASEPALGDYDNDGDLDLFQTNVYEGRESNFYRSLLVEDGELGFEEVSYPSGARVDNGWGAVWADIDGDGDLDLLSRGLFRNDGPSGHWLEVRLHGGEAVDRFGAGAVIVVEAGGDRYTRQVSAGKGVGNQSPFEQHFGLGEHARYDRIRIRWPGGGQDIQPCGEADRRLAFVQGQIEPEPPEGCGEAPEEPGGCACGGQGRGSESAFIVLAGLLAALAYRRSGA
ncbi:MAG: CRTAC1 family protein [Deltaproteobacteria bacterium]|nr:CRTAC1 family protein [Deltaproteobacteria bacterium]